MRLILAAAAVALVASTADLGARPVAPPTSHRFEGVFTLRFFAPNGPEPREITGAEYADFVKHKACLVKPDVRYGSAASVWSDHVISITCEL